jgi:transposase
MTNRDYKDNIEKVLRERIGKGHSYQAIADTLDVSKMQVSRWADKYKIKPVNKFPGGFK